jgi:hypothetical protein
MRHKKWWISGRNVTRLAPRSRESQPGTELNRKDVAKDVVPTERPHFIPAPVNSRHQRRQFRDQLLKKFKIRVGHIQDSQL